MADDAAHERPAVGWRAAVAWLAVLALAGCGGEEAETRSRRAEANVLTRQQQQLGGLIEAAGLGRLVSGDWLAIALDEAALQAIIEASLGQEVLIDERYRVALRRAQVSFSSGSAVVTLEVRVSDERRAGIGAVVIVNGGLDDFSLDDQGRLQTRVLIDHIEVPKATLLTGVVDRVAGQQLAAVQSRMPVLTIPVKLLRSLALGGRDDGPVAFQPGEVPVTARLARVLPIGGRLWVFLDVSFGSWQAREPSAALTAPAPSAPVPLDVCPRPGSSAPSADVRGAQSAGQAVSSAREAEPLVAAPSREMIDALVDERQRLRDELRRRLSADVLREYDDPPGGAILLGVPAPMAEEILTRALTGPLADAQVRLAGIETRLEGELASPIPFTPPLGRYTVDIDVADLQARLQPGAPRFDFRDGAIGVELPVTLAGARFAARVRVRFEGGTRIGRLCGVIDVATEIESDVKPATHEIVGTLELAVEDDRLLARPRFGQTTLHVELAPTDATWRSLSAAVDDVRRGTNLACAAAIGSVDIDGILRRAVERGFDIPLPAEPANDIVLPAGIEREFCAGDRLMRVNAQPESLRIRPAMIWYGKALRASVGSGELR